MKALTFNFAEDFDLPYLLDLERKNNESVGFLPRMAFEEHIKKGRVIIGRLNADPFGYLMFDDSRGKINVLQACIQYDARRRLYGAHLYQWFLDHLRPEFVRLKCAADLESNLFWRSMGLICVGITDGGSRRKRKINIWHHYFQPQLLIVQVAPACQLREDCFDDETGFLSNVPAGFRGLGNLGKLAWKNRK